MSRPIRRLPSLNALRAFWAAARHGSFVAAAEELHVTASAVSLQVRQLEDELGQKLFDRTPRGLSLTADGAAILPGVSDAFARLQATLIDEQPGSDQQILTLSVAPSFATKWLLPRLDSFCQRYPDFDVRVIATHDLTDFAKENVDLAIRYGRGGYTGLASELLMRESVFPVCAPRLVETHADADVAQLLRALPLLHDDSPDQDETCPDWKSWLKAAGLRDIDAQRGSRFNQSIFALEAAASGLGVALAKSSLVQQDLATRRLVRLGHDDVPIEFAYFLVYPPERGKRSAINAFRNWIQGEIDAHRGALKQPTAHHQGILLATQS
ncbi:transcriptional regulator GcvA [Dongia rigui]|uniref:Transcriptional regulator GcvA n=1 Tax=Dongia rigui TaxID=940149 RepID=A0ABU5DTJ4_9PROT|nr:transcriptional regulator GcvA [Dongia rigui]MDY0870335.1 transcriptional regulator GcvA [Dongia rigui]